MSKKRKKRPPGRTSNFKKQLEVKAARTGLTRLPTIALVATIDTMIGILQDRGVKIWDWDNKDKVVQKIKCIGGKVYILAHSEQPKTEAVNGENVGHETG